MSGAHIPRNAASMANEVAGFAIGLAAVCTFITLWVARAFPEFVAYNIIIAMIALGLYAYARLGIGVVMVTSVALFFISLWLGFYSKTFAFLLLGVILCAIAVLFLGKKEIFKEQWKMDKELRDITPWLAVPVAAALASLPNVLVLVLCVLGIIKLDSGIGQIRAARELDGKRFFVIQIIGMAVLFAVLMFDAKIKYSNSVWLGDARYQFLGGNDLFREAISFVVFWVLITIVSYMYFDGVAMVKARYVEDDCKKVAKEILGKAGLVRNPSAVNAYIQAIAEEDGGGAIGVTVTQRCARLGVLPVMLDDQFREMVEKSLEKAPVKFVKNTIQYSLINAFSLAWQMVAYVKARGGDKDSENLENKNSALLAAGLPFPFIFIFALCYSPTFLALAMNEAKYGRQVKVEEQTDNSSRFAQTGKM